MLRAILLEYFGDGARVHVIPMTSDEGLQPEMHWVFVSVGQPGEPPDTKPDVLRIDMNLLRHEEGLMDPSLLGAK